MKFLEYFKKGRNYFVALVVFTLLQAVASVFALYPRLIIDPLGVIGILIVGYAGYKLRLGLKQSAVLGVLMFLTVIWYVLLVIPGAVFATGLTSILLVIATNALLNLVIYAIAAVMGNLIANKLKSRVR